MDETDASLHLLARCGKRINISRLICNSANEIWYYRLHNEHARYHLSLFYDNAYEILEYYPMRIIISTSNLLCNFKLMSHRVAAKRVEPFNINERQSSCKYYFIFCYRN